MVSFRRLEHNSLSVIVVCLIHSWAFGLPDGNDCIAKHLFICLYRRANVVIIADFFRNICNTCSACCGSISVFNVGWDQVTESLEQTPIATKEEIQALDSDESFQGLPEEERQERINKIDEK